MHFLVHSVCNRVLYEFQCLTALLEVAILCRITQVTACIIIVVVRNLVVSFGYQSTRHRRNFFTESIRHTVKSSHSHLITSQHCTKLQVGTQNSVGMQILKVTTNVKNLGAPDP